MDHRIYFSDFDATSHLDHDADRDPIVLCLVSEEEARMLFEFFWSHLNQAVSRGSGVDYQMVPISALDASRIPFELGFISHAQSAAHCGF